MHPAHPGDKSKESGTRDQKSGIRGQRSEVRIRIAELFNCRGLWPAVSTTHYSSLFTHHFFSTPAGSRTQTSTFGGSRDVRFTTRARRPEIRSQRSEVRDQRSEVSHPHHKPIAL